MKRLSLYVFYDKNGVVQDYVTYYIKGLQHIAQDIIVIINGNVSPEGRQKLDELGVDILVRDNKGWDFSAWKAALEYKGWDTILSYDEILLCNCSCYGPIYPFDSIFEKMNKMDCDFWGLNRHLAVEGQFPAHIQSYFVVLRKKLVSDKIFQIYWKNLNVARSWRDAVHQETHFTEYFERHGFRSCTFMPDEYEKMVHDTTIRLPHYLLSKGFPLLKRKLFFSDYHELIFCSNGEQARDALEYIKNNTNYPEKLITDDILANAQNSKIREKLHNTYILSDKVSPQKIIEKRIALIIYSYFKDLISITINYIHSMPLNSHIYIVVCSEEMKILWDKSRTKLNNYKIFIRIQENRGRNENAYWLTCRDVVENYDLLCVAHDKKTPSAKPPLIGYYFNKHCWDNILKTPEYVNNIINLFHEQNNLGILMPPTLLFGGYDKFILNNEWGDNKKLAQEIYRKLNLHIPFDESPYAPWGAMFWFRGQAMRPFYRYNWKVDDFPEEPLTAQDGTVLHALERMYPMIAQEAGFFSAWIIPSSQSGLYIDNMYYLLKRNYVHNNYAELNKKIYQHVIYYFLRFKYHTIKVHTKKILIKIRKLLS